MSNGGLDPAIWFAGGRRSPREASPVELPASRYRFALAWQMGAPEVALLATGALLAEHADAPVSTAR